MEQLDLGRAAMTPRGPVEAGAWITRVYTYTAGHPIDDTGYVKIAFRFAGDFGVPQFTDPAGENYCSVSTTGDCRIEPRWDPKGNTRPWGRSIYLKITRGYLGRGEKIRVVFGDTRHGSPGWQSQTFCEKSFEFKTLVDPIATYEFKELHRSPTLRIVPGPPERAVCIAPSRVEAGRGFPYFLKLEDGWGNPVRRPFRRKHRGFYREGVYRVEAADVATGLSGRSNPIRAVARGTVTRSFWADLHGQSEETIGSNTIEEYFAFARDYGLVEISGHQGNDFQVTDAFWKEINRVTRRFNQEGRFVTFPGYEWSGNTPLGGDRNVYFRSEGGEIVHSCVDLLPGKTSAHPTAATADELFAELDKQARRGPFVISHVGGRYADMGMHDPGTEIAVEIHSAWGTFPWLAEDAFERGCRVGICASSDGHKGRPGASYPGARKFGSLGGLTCILAPRLDRRNIYRALKARRFYATTGNRSLLRVRVRTGKGREARMGDVVERGDEIPRLLVEAEGTAPIESVEVRNGTKRIKTFRPYGKGLGNRIKLLWSGAEVRGRGRMVTWDGELAVNGNSVKEIRAVNFFNPLRQPCRAGRNRVRWQSATTGGHAGLIITLGKPAVGSLEIQTEQRTTKCGIRSIGGTPRTWNCGGLDKKLAVYRLPARSVAAESISFELPLTELRQGDNPIYVRVNQEDGHSAWSSPVYVVV